jgi:hypothetical protein
VTEPSSAGVPNGADGNPGQSREHRPRRHRGYAAGGSGLLLAGALGYIALADPHDASSVYPQCPFRLLTGWNCPFCGGLRMTHDLLHGDLAASINDNVFLLFVIPIFAGWVVVRRRRSETPMPPPALLTMTAVVIAWTVIRNLPGFPLVPTVLPG